MKNMEICRRMVTSVKSIRPEASIYEGLAEMLSFKIRHLPVIVNGEFKGIVSERDLKAAANITDGPPLSVGDVMKQDIFLTSATTPLSQVAGIHLPSVNGPCSSIDCIVISFKSRTNRLPF